MYWCPWVASSSNHRHWMQSGARHASKSCPPLPRVARDFALDLQASFENIGEAEMGINERDVGPGEQRRVGDLVRKYRHLLVGRETLVEVQRDRRLLGQQSIGDY